VTGERASLSSSVAPLVELMRVITDLPLAVGFGISTPDQVRAVGSVADAVVVGSAIVRAVEQGASLEELARGLSSALPSKDA